MISGAFSRNPSTDFHMIFLAHLVSKQGKGSALESRNWLSLFSRLIQYPAAPPFFSFLATCFIQFYTLPREGQQDFFRPCHRRTARLWQEHYMWLTPVCFRGWFSCRGFLLTSRLGGH
jgi:hypothetical protein